MHFAATQFEIHILQRTDAAEIFRNLIDQQLGLRNFLALRRHGAAIPLLNPHC